MDVDHSCLWLSIEFDNLDRTEGVPEHKQEFANLCPKRHDDIKRLRKVDDMEKRWSRVSPWERNECGDFYKVEV